MTLPKYNDLSAFDLIFTIDQEILKQEKSLLDLRIKRFTARPANPHLFIHGKRRLAQLKFKKSRLQKGNK